MNKTILNITSILGVSTLVALMSVSTAGVISWAF